jgi:hypothetical protein
MRRFVLPVLLLPVLVAAFFIVWSQYREVAPPPVATKRAPATSVEAPPGDSPATVDEAVRARDSSATVESPALDESPPRFPAKRESASLVAVVVDQAHTPVAGVEVQIDSWIGGHLQELAIADDRDVHRATATDDEGRVAFKDLAEGGYRITARAADGRSVREDLDFSKAQADRPLRLVLSSKPRRAPAVEITVVAADGALVEGANVELCGATINRGLVGVRGRAPPRARSDEHGIARFEGIRWLRGMAFAETSDGRRGAQSFTEVGESAQGVRTAIERADPREQLRQQIDSIAASVELMRSIEQEGEVYEHSTARDFVSAKVTVATPGRIVGSIEFAPGASADDEALAGASIEAWLADVQVTWLDSYGRATTVPVAERAFAIDGLAPGSWSLVLHAPGGARLVLERAIENGKKQENSVAPPLAEVNSGATTSVRLRVTLGATIDGHVHRPDGTPIAGAHVVATLSPWNRWLGGDAYVRRQMHVWSFGLDSGLESPHPLTHVVTRTDAHGDYRLVGLQPGFQRILVTARELSFDRRDWIKVVDGQRVALDHVLEPAGALQGIAPNCGLFGITREGNETPLAIASIEDTQSFLFGGLRPGVYIISEFPEEREKPGGERGRATVEAGRTTFVDLSDAPGRIEVAGQVVDDHGPVTSVVVEYGQIRRPVDGAGGFVFHSGLDADEGVHYLAVETDQLWKTFLCKADSSSGGSWHGTLHLGSEVLRIEARQGTGAPLAGWVELSTHVAGLLQQDADSVQTKRIPLDANGATTIERLDPGRYDLQVVASDGGHFDSHVSLPRTDVLQIDFGEYGSLVVHVFDADGNPSTTCSIEARTWLGEGGIPDDVSGHVDQFCATSETVNRDGTARLARVRSGKVLVEIPSNPFFSLLSGLGNAPPPAQPLASVRIELAPGEERDVEIHLPRAEHERR